MCESGTCHLRPRRFRRHFSPEPFAIVAQAQELARPNPWEWLDITLLTVCYGYGYLALRRVSGQSWAITLGKYAVLSMLYGLVMTIGMLAIVVITLLLG